MDDASLVRDVDRTCNARDDLCSPSRVERSILGALLKSCAGHIFQNKVDTSIVEVDVMHPHQVSVLGERRE